MKRRIVKNGTLEIYNDDQIIFTLSETISDGSMLISLGGQISNLVASEFEDEVMAALTVCHKLRLDFSEVTYIASGVLRVLLSAQQVIDSIEGAEMVLVGVTGEVMTTLHEAGFDDILEIEKD